MKKLIFLTILFSMPLQLSAKTDTVIAGFQGTQWREFDRMQKIIYLKGIYSVILFEDVKNEEAFITKTSIKTIEDGIDDFYKEPANRNIIILYALKVVSMKIKGADAATIEKVTILYRKVFADL